MTYGTNKMKLNSPAEDTKNEVHNEECTQDDHGHKKYPLPAVTHGICNLGREGTSERRMWW